MSSNLEFAILGPLSAWRGGDNLDLGAPQQRAVLAALLLAGGRQVSLESLVDAVWEDPPQAAARIVRTYVSQLRRALMTRGSREIITSSGNGYVLPRERVSVDAERFTELTEAARAARGDGADLARAGELLRQAVGLWRGEPLAGVPGPYAQAQRARLAELHLTAVEDRLAIDVELGGHAAAVAELQELAASHPLRERLRELLMLALYRAGRQADALAVFQDTRRMLGDMLGIDPGPALQAMHQRILEMDETLLPVPRPGAVAAAVPLRVAGPLVRPAQLPPGPLALAGRDRELALLDSLLKDAEYGPPFPVIATIDGMPGIGKTTLAVHWAHQAADRFPDGVLHADVRGHGPDGTLRAFLEALGVPPDRLPGHPASQAGLYRSLMHDRRMLLMLDNASRAEDIRPLLPGTGSSMVIVTSRSQLTGLTATHGARRVALGPLSAEDSRSMLASRLHPLRVAAEPDAVREIAEICAGVPLALAVVAARAAVGHSLAAILSELRDPATRLCALSTTDTAANTCAAFSLSYQQLSLPARRVLELLAQQEDAAFTLTTAAAVTGTAPGEARQLLNELTTACMLTEWPDGRYVLHELVRSYVACPHPEYAAV